jgi:uncharacterized membrane protein YuzA (DUF378 family)
MVHWVAWMLALVGALNWGLVGVGGFMGADYNLVHMILSSWPMVEWAVYVLVGASAVALIVGCKCATCNSDMK